MFIIAVQKSDSVIHTFVVQLVSCVQLFSTPWTAKSQGSLSFTIFWNSLKPMSIESVMPSNHLILCCPLLFMNSLFPSIRVFSSESALHSRWRPSQKAKVLELHLQHQSFWWIFRIDFLLGLVWSPCCSRDSQESSAALQFETIDSSVLSLLFGPTSILSYMTTGKIISLTRQTFVGKMMSLLFNTLSRFVIAFLPSSKHLLITHTHTYIYILFHILSTMVYHRILNMLYSRTLFLKVGACVCSLKSPQILQHSLQLDLWTWNHLRCLLFPCCLLAYLRVQFPTNHICLSFPSLKVAFLNREGKTETACPVFPLLAFSRTFSDPEHRALAFCSLLPVLNSAQSQSIFLGLGQF